MSDWQPIETAPTDGRAVMVKRVYADMTFGPYKAVFSTMAEDAPMRQWGPGGLDGPIPPDHGFANIPAWCSADRRFHVPGPTHWMPLSSQPAL